MLEITNLRKKYDGFALGPIDLTLEPGTVHGLIGPNGAGQTTLYRTVMGTVRRDQGLVKVGERHADASSGEWKRKIGYVGDFTPLFEHWSGARNINAFAAFYDACDEPTAAGRGLRRCVRRVRPPRTGPESHTRSHSHRRAVRERLRGERQHFGPGVPLAGLD